MNTTIVETAGRYRVRLVPDTDAVNPRKDFDPLVHVITWADPHHLPVDDDGGPLQDGWDRVTYRPDAVEVFTRWARVFHGAVVTEHTPERGPRSLWYMLPEQTAEIGCTPEEAIAGEITEYQSWADGEVYGYIIEKASTWVRKDDPADEMTTWEQEDSCWGFIGYAWAETSARDAFAPFKEESTT